MKELIIYQFQAAYIENTLRTVANILESRTRETCIDRQVVKAISMIKEVLAKTITK